MPYSATHLYFQLYPSYNTNRRLVFINRDMDPPDTLAKFLGAGPDPQPPYGCAYDSRCSCNEGSVAEVGPRPTDEKRNDENFFNLKKCLPRNYHVVSLQNRKQIVDIVTVDATMTRNIRGLWRSYSTCVGRRVSADERQFQVTIS